MCQNVRGVSDQQKKKKNGAPPTTSGPGYAASLKHCLCNLVFMQERKKKKGFDWVRWTAAVMW